MHENDVHDPGYRRFVEPVVSAVERRFSAAAQGLDFGAGTGPVIAHLLTQKGYRVELYDPFFWDRPQALQKAYDFVICCEVAEHFHSPAREFELLRSLLKPGGELMCMTQLYDDDIDFKAWYYKNDPTHVFFYRRDTLDWIRKRFGFSSVESAGRLQIFSV